MLLGIDVTGTLSTAAYVDRLLMQFNQRLYLLSVLQSSGLQDYNALHCISSSSVVSNKLTHALPAYAADDKNRINAISRKAMRSGVNLPKNLRGTRTGLSPSNESKFLKLLPLPPFARKNLLT